MKEWRHVPFCLAVVVSVFALTPAAFAVASKDVRDATACGLDNASYSVHLNDNPAPNVPPPPGKALVYFIQDEQTDGLISHTTRMGLDGNWAGANKGTSYFSVLVDPGVHHICANTETVMDGHPIELAHFTAETGQTYYFHTQLVLTRYVQLFNLTLLDTDEGAYLAGSLPLSQSKLK